MGLDGGWSEQPEGFLDVLRDICAGTGMLLMLIAVIAAPWVFLLLLRWWLG